MPENLLEKVVADLSEIKNILENKKERNPYELLDAKQIAAEYGIGYITVSQKIFKEKELPVQTYTTPFKVMRKDIEEFFSKRHDYLSNKE